MSQQKFSTEGLRSFFERFQSLSADADALAAMYAATFIMAGPSGAQMVPSSALLGAIPKRKQLIDSAGHRQTTLVGFEEQTLTDRYSLVRAEWRWEFEPMQGPPVDLTLPATFIVDRGGEQPRIILYMNQQDIAAALRERGLLPAT